MKPAPRKVPRTTLGRYFPGEVQAPAGNQPPVLAPPKRPSQVRWTKELRYALELFRPHTLYVLATETPGDHTHRNSDLSVHRRFGHNRGCWPVQIGTTSSATPWREKVTSFFNTGPYDRVEVKTWLWLASPQDAADLAREASQFLKSAAEMAGYDALENGWLDAGPDFKSGRFEEYVLLLARKGTPTLKRTLVWTTQELHSFLEHSCKLAPIKGIRLLDDRGRRIGGEMAHGFIRLCDQLLERERGRLLSPSRCS